MNALGIHIIADLFECNKKTLSSLKKIRAIAEEAAQESHATIVFTMATENSQGVGVRVVIAESHISILSAPEHGLAYVEVFTCGNVIDSSAAVIYIAKKLESKKQTITERKMGILSIENKKLSHKVTAET